jgi:hypothetical protein
VYSTPTGLETIAWSSGPSELDNATFYPLKRYGPEFKFVRPPINLGVVYKGFRNTDGPNFPGGSVATQSGSGNGGPFAGTVWGTNYESSWTIRAGGTLGAPTLTAPGYQTSAAVNDPWLITPSQLASTGVTGTSYDLYTTVGLLSGQFSRGGEITMDVSYQTAAGTLSLLDISISPTNVVVNGDSDAKFFLQSSLTEGPTGVPSELRTLTQLTTDLKNNISANTILSPMFLGIEADNLSVPTQVLSDGAVAFINVDTSVSDSGAVPEPSTLVLASIACAAFMATATLRLRAKGLVNG